MKKMTVALGCACLLTGLMAYLPLATATPSCGAPDDPFADFYSGSGSGKAWRITMVTHDHEDHGLHLVEGDSFTVRYNASCEVVLAPGPQLATRWGNYSRLLERGSYVSSDLSRVENELCTTVGIVHEQMGAQELIARPHILRMKMIGNGDGRKLQIKYSHRVDATNDCSSDGSLSNVHGGTAHAED